MRNKEKPHWRRLVAESRGARLAALIPRSAYAVRHLGNQFRYVAKWLATSREHTNFTYSLTPRNVDQLMWFVVAVTRSAPNDIRTYLDELAQDERFAGLLRNQIRKSPRSALADERVLYGRRLAWYAIVRALKPNFVVETGTDKGLGSMVIAAALLRNGSGRLLTIDINPASGSLVTEPYAEFVTLVIDDSLRAIASLKVPVDIFLHDSDHSTEHEMAELTSIAPQLSEHSLVLSDNAHVSQALANWAQQTGRRFLYFAEEPEEHWFRGAGVGAAWRSND